MINGIVFTDCGDHTGTPGGRHFLHRDFWAVTIGKKTVVGFG